MESSTASASTSTSTIFMVLLLTHDLYEKLFIK